jgi:hypothetical protein
MPMSDRELDRIFAAIQDETAHPTADLKARMLADASVFAPRPVVGAPAKPKPLSGWLERIADALGGWVTVGGLTACLALGITFGAAPEDLLTFLPAADDEQISLSLSLGDTLFAELP